MIDIDNQVNVTDWVPLTGLSTGWTAIENAAYKLFATGEVVFRGGVTRSVGATATSATILTLPSGFSPLNESWYQVNSNANSFNSAGSGASIRITTSGIMQGYIGNDSDSRYFHLETVRYFTR